MMRTRKLLLLTAALLAAGPAQAQASDRVIEVKVVNGQIQVPESTVRVGRSVGAIRWDLATAGFTFPATGIVIDGAAFKNCKPQAQGRRFHCVRNGHVAGAQYKYDVNVNQGSKALPTLDPIIQNE